MKKDNHRLSICRRELLAGAAYIALGASGSSARVIFAHLPWKPNAGSPPPAAALGPWHFFTGEEGRSIEALADRIIPPDSDTPGGKDCGSAVFIDRQLAGPYGRQDGLYVRPPFLKGAKNQGHQSEKSPTQEYREGLAALDKCCRAQFGGMAFCELSDTDKDRVLRGLESGEFKLDGVDGKAFFEQVVKDVQMGFFADPIYGGNRNMVAWKMIGYPGAGQIMEGGNPFEGSRSRPYPTTAQVQPFSHALFGKAARELGYKPFRQPSGNLSQAYTNALGLKMGPCTYCGFCEWFGCSNYSKASPQTTILPYLVRKPNFSARDNSEVNSAEVTTLCLAHGTSEQQLHADLREATRLELVQLLDGSYAFVHDRVQEAAYGLQPDEAKRADLHVRIGMALAAQAAPDETSERVYLLANQLNRGSPP